MKKLLQDLNTRLAIVAAVILVGLLLSSLYFLSKVFYDSARVLNRDLNNEISLIYSKGQDQHLFDMADFLGKKLFTATFDTDISGLNDKIQRVSSWAEAKRILILDRQAKVLTDGTIRNVRYGEQFILPHNLDSKNVVFVDSVKGHRDIYFVIGDESTIAGYGVITLALEQRYALETALNRNIDNAIKAFKKGFNFYAAMSIIFILVACFGLGFWLYRSLSLPILKMIKAAEEFSLGNYSYEIPQLFRSKSEVGRLAGALNKMAVNIQEAEEKIIYQAHFDNLTGLPNRFLIHDRLELSLTESTRNKSQVAVLFLDLDGFKKVNDSLGHDIGDKLLIEASERIASVLREGDTVGRLGGDEFIVILKGLNQAQDAKLSAKNILKAFRSTFNIDNRELAVTTSIGIATFPENGANCSELLRHADSAMYHAKELGRNGYAFFSDEMNTKISRQLLLEEHLSSALEKQEFHVVYQPKYDVIDNTIVGAEVLLRWRNSELGFVSPEEFIPILEQSSLISDVGEFVLEQAIAQTEKWRNNFQKDFKVAVNLSPRQLRSKNLVETIEDLLAAYKVDTSILELEITEGVLMETHVRIKHILNTLSDKGISLAMDDFGKGYSSLSYLRNFPFDVVKIDRSFINDIATDDEDRELISAAIAMAHALNLKVVAEGVETAEQRDYLKQNKCDQAQGYFYSKPVEPEQFTTLLKKQSESQLDQQLTSVNV